MEERDGKSGKPRLTEGLKYDEEKARFDLLPPGAMEAVAAVYTYGANKYEDRNMERGMAWGRVYGAIHRHLNAFWNGEDKDPESGMLHVTHAAWGCLTLIDYLQNKQFEKFDDRPHRHPDRLKVSKMNNEEDPTIFKGGTDEDNINR